MPCSYYLPGEEEAIKNNNLRKDLDRLTHENDQLREIVLEHARAYIPEDILKGIEKTQTQHRREDLARLEETFEEKITDISKKKPTSNTKDERREVFTLLQRVLAADPSFPLEPQLGFDPDKY